MAGKYGAVVTDTGTRKIMEAMHEGRKVNIIEFAVGDGGGAPCTPDLSAVGLINENWRGKVDSCYVSEESENLLIIETTMPSDIGGFTIREMGVFDDEGALIAICNVPDTQKVKISDGVVHELNLIMEIALSNLEGIELVVDPCVVMATKKDIKNINEKLDKFFGSMDNPNGGIEFVEGIKANNVIDAINEVFTIGNEKKQKLVENLIAVGVEASTDESWETLLSKIEAVKQLGYNTGLKDNSNSNIAAVINPSDIHVYNGGGTQNITVAKRSAIYMAGSVGGWSHPNAGGAEHMASINLKVNGASMKYSSVRAHEGERDSQGNYTTYADGVNCNWSGTVNAGANVRVEISKTEYYNDSTKCSSSSQIVVVGFK